MTDISHIQKGAEVIGADGVHIGIVDHVHGDQITLTRRDSVDNKHHHISTGLIADIEGGKVRLSANADVAVTFET
ncbi:MAG: DUF2171 domain-containing protein [Caulobacteraceae bacterium]